MTEDEYVTKIHELWPSGLSPSQWIDNKPLYLDLVATVDEALREYPQSSRLWCIRGDILQLQARPWDICFNPAPFVECYQKAIVLDNRNWYAFESLAIIFDIYYKDYAEAERLFLKAISLGAEQCSYVGRARALAQMGWRQEAIKQLSHEMCPYADSPDINKLRKEIDEGGWGPLEPHRWLGQRTGAEEIN